MRRTLLFVLTIGLLFALAIPVFGANEASQVNVSATVNQNQSCQVVASVTMTVDQADSRLRFPVPLEAHSILLNGSGWVHVTKTQQAQFIDLRGLFNNMLGQFTFTVQYTLPNVIAQDSTGAPELRLPLLSGFEYPISRLEFNIQMPGNVTAKPAFSSGYHQANIEKDLSCTVSGASITGYSVAELKDHETLTITLPVEETLFPAAPLVFDETNVDDIAMLICAGLALVYWLIFLRCPPLIRRSAVSAPEGITAGQLEGILTLGKADLSMMVFSWAQLGYLRIQLDRRRVLLHKRMDMGNERSGFEQRCFNALFGRRSTVDTSGLHFSVQSTAVSKLRGTVQPLIHPRSGNVVLFRALGALVALFCGVSFGISISQGSVLQGFLVLCFAVIAGFLGYWIQPISRELFLRKTGQTVISVLACVLWLALGLWAGQLGLALIVLLSQLLVGLMAFWGGRRTETGVQYAREVLGFRHYLRTVSKEEIRRISVLDPEYFYTMAPYAIALGVDRSFAKRFGKAPLPECPYITLSANTPHRAAQWSEHMRNILAAMNRRRQRMPLERLMDAVASLLGK